MIGCPRCLAPIDGEVVSAQRRRCSYCHVPLRVELFPALLRDLGGGERAEGVSSDEEASCFFHDRSRAAVACEGCGRFLCSLCDLEVDGRHLCAGCLESGERAASDRLVSERTLWDGIALSLAILPMITCYFTLITAPMVIFLCFYHWRSPSSVVNRSRVRFVVAFVLASLQILLWIGLGAALIVGLGRA